MATVKSIFHVRHNARPDLVREVLEILNGAGTVALEDMLEIGARRGYQIGTAVQSKQSLKENALQVAVDLGIVESHCLTLTPLGKQLVCLLHQKPAKWSEIMHVLFYTRWEPECENEPHFRFSWSYRTACDTLWEFGSTTIDRGQLVSLLFDAAREHFNEQKISLSKDSIRGILQWLQELQPSVLDKDNKLFRRRTFCPPETFALAVEYLYRLKKADYQCNLLLDVEKQDILCKLCLLEPTAFDTVFDWAVGQYPFLRRGTSGGWGSYVLLTCQPQIQDFLG
jgi:hypothetical protein